ncbi:hypothetical protein [uncultured Sutterella sp.]|uniref:hypothetical protein n=1 Tax=uncultured Sutterella sp. TaxID=286133 RepID=UPI0025F3EF37|nr:hypothetical protein [uncultured Sutterella sp.]
MKKTLLTGLVLAALSPLVFAAPDGMSGATKKASDAAQTIGNVDAITSASVVPQNLRQTVKPTASPPATRRRSAFSLSSAIRATNPLNGISSTRR